MLLVAVVILDAGALLAQWISPMPLELFAACILVGAIVGILAATRNALAAIVGLVGLLVVALPEVVKRLGPGGDYWWQPTFVASATAILVIAVADWLLLRRQVRPNITEKARRRPGGTVG